MKSKKEILSWLLRLALGGTLIYAGVLKIADPQTFADSIAGFQIVPHELISLIALSLPPFEILLGLALVLAPISQSFNKSISQSADLAAVCLFAAFVFMLGQAIVRGIEVECGCFGSGGSGGIFGGWLESFSPTVQAWLSLLRAFVLLLGAAFLYFAQRHRDTENHRG